MKRIEGAHKRDANSELITGRNHFNEVGFSFVGWERRKFHWGKSQNTDFLVQKLKHLSW